MRLLTIVVDGWSGNLGHNETCGLESVCHDTVATSQHWRHVQSLNSLIIYERCLTTHPWEEKSHTYYTSYDCEVFQIHQHAVVVDLAALLSYQQVLFLLSWFD